MDNKQELPVIIITTVNESEHQAGGKSIFMTFESFIGAEDFLSYHQFIYDPIIKNTLRIEKLDNLLPPGHQVLDRNIHTTIMKKIINGKAKSLVDFNIETIISDIDLATMWVLSK